MDIRMQKFIPILHDAPTITELARSAAVNANPNLKRPYLSLSNELKYSIEEIEQYAHQEEINRKVQTLNNVNSELVKMEHEAFRQIERGNPKVAENILYGEEYIEKALQFDNMSGELVTMLEESIENDLSEIRRRSYYSISAIMFCFLLIMVVWILIIQFIRRNVEERNRLMGMLKNLSTRDSLTGLYNRRGFLTLARQQKKISDRMNRKMLLIFCDLDGLKKINDSWGHGAGDRAIKETAAILKYVFRKSDIIARLGGDEFVVLTLETQPGDIENIEKRLQAVLKNHNEKSDTPYTISVSLGKEIYDPEQPRDIIEWISMADDAMYEEKKKKR